MNIKSRLSAVSLALLMVPAAFAADTAQLQKQIEAQQRTMIQMQNEMQKMNKEMASMRGELEKLQFDMKNQAQAAGPATAQQTATNPGQGQQVAQAAPAQQGASPAADQLSAADTSAQMEYDKAYNYISQNDLDKAATAFSAYVKKYPSNSLTPNAWYWLGQVQYNKSKFDEARVSFLNVARFEGSQKRPDSLYKLGIISKLNGDKDKAQKYFQLVIQSYPNDAVASLAKKELN